MRRRSPQKRETMPDPKFGDRTLTVLINTLLSSGRKSVAEQIVYGAIDIVSKRTTEDPVRTFHKAIDNIKPMVEVKSRRVGGSTYQVPVEVAPDRRLTLALRWLRDYARARGERGMAEKIAGEIMDAAANRGGAVKKKEDTHRMAEANRAFAHYRF